MSGKIKLGVSVIVVKEVAGRRHLLMGQRLSRTGYFEWAFAGGKVEDGETVFDAASRELKEEGNLQLRRVVRVTRIMDNLKEHYLNFGLLVEADGTPKDTAEMANWAYFPEDELPEPLFKYAREDVERLAEGSVQPRTRLENLRQNRERVN